MLYVATVHFRSPRWIEIQTSHLREHLRVPYQVWTSLDRIDPSYGSFFDRVLDQKGVHPGKLNHMAMEIAQEADRDDLIMFLDGDAFPIADPMPLIEDGLARGELVAVRRAEQVNEPQPHACFCVTTIGTWLKLPGDWTGGPTWPSARGHRATDVGGNLLRRLELTKTPWSEVLRSNRRNLDPLYYAIYGDVIYHHGAGFRTGELSPVHRDLAPSPLAAPDLRLLGAAVRRFNGLRFRVWEQRFQRRHVRESQRIYELISRGGDGWLKEFI
jgi:hypothetical protein